MPYTKEDGDRLNNFAVQPKMYVAEPPNKKQQRKYMILGVVSLLLVGGLVFVAFSISWNEIKLNADWSWYARARLLKRNN